MKLVLNCAKVVMLSAVTAVAFAEADKPLLQEGKKSTYQRVLTAPGCRLTESAGAVNGVPQPEFSRFYIYERAIVEGENWLYVGPDSFGKKSGWLPEKCTVKWNMQLTVAFTNPANRDRLIFFKDREKLEEIVNAADPVSYIAPIRAKLKNSNTAPGVVAQEPATFIDMHDNFYLLPILQGEEVMTEEGFRMRMLNVASVSRAEKDENVTLEEASSQLKAFSAAVVFVIDSSISMDPYIERTREAIKQVYSTIEKDGLSEQVKFGLVAYRSNVKAVPGLEYVSQLYVDPTQVKSGDDFLEKVKDLKQAKVSSKLYAEDAYSGVMQALDEVDWSKFGARYIVLITDASAIEGDHELSGTGLSAKQVRLEAAKPGVAIYTLHLKTPGGTKDHSVAEAQYQELSTYGGTNTSLYYPVNAGSVQEFGAKVDTLAKELTKQVKLAYAGDSSLGSALNAADDVETSAADKKMLEDAEIVGNAMRLAFLGERVGSKAPPVFEAWVTDRDLIKQNIPTTDVRVLLTKSQLSDLSDVVKQILDAANEGLISPADMFTKLRSVAATMGADPQNLKNASSAKIADIGIMAEFLADLPYHSEVMSLDEQTWSSWDGLSQEKFIRNLSIKLRHYQRYNEDVSRWVPLAPGADARDNIYPIPLEMMP